MQNTVFSKTSYSCAFLECSQFYTSLTEMLPKLHNFLCYVYHCIEKTPIFLWILFKKGCFTVYIPFFTHLHLILRIFALRPHGSSLFSTHLHGFEYLCILHNFISWMSRFDPVILRPYPFSLHNFRVENQWLQALQASLKKKRIVVFKRKNIKNNKRDFVVHY